MLWCVRFVNVMMSNEWLSWKNSEGKNVTHNLNTHTNIFVILFCVFFVFLQCWCHGINTLERNTENCNTSMLFTSSVQKKSSQLINNRHFGQHQLLLFVMVTHTHSISMHTPNVYSSLQITHPCVFLFALRLLILHHRYEQQLFKETWQWFHPRVPQCEWTWLSETSHLTKCHIRMILWIHGYINDTKCERVRHAWTQSTFLEVHRVFGSVSIVFRENRTKNDGHNNFNWNFIMRETWGSFSRTSPHFSGFCT